MTIHHTPKGELNKFHQIFGITAVFIFWSMLFFIARIFSKYSWSRRIPFISGLVGILTVVLSILLAPKFIPEDALGNWSVSFHYHYTTISNLQYYQPMRTIIPIGFSFVSFGMLLITSMGWKFRKELFCKQEKNRTALMVKLLIVLWAALNLALSFGILGSAVFAKHTDYKVHTCFAGVVFSVAPLFTMISSILLINAGGKAFPRYAYFIASLILTIAILSFSIKNLFIVYFIMDFFLVFLQS